MVVCSCGVVFRWLSSDLIGGTYPSQVIFIEVHLKFISLLQAGANIQAEFYKTSHTIMALRIPRGA